MFSVEERSIYSEADISLYESVNIEGNETGAYNDASQYFSQSGYKSVYGGAFDYIDPYAVEGESGDPSGYEYIYDDAPPLKEPNVISSQDFFANFYWNSAFQALLERPVSTKEEGLIRHREINELLDSFIDQAKPVVQKIIEEVNVSNPKKEIQPISAGGIAGGDKFLEQQFFFKFASEAEAISLYGGAHQAQKAASHELRALNSLLGCGVAHLHFPLVTVCTYLGWRIIVVSQLPIGKDSIIYGSADAGKTIYSDKTFHNIFGKCAEQLKLKEHRARDASMTTHLLHGPVDLEGHLGADGRMYIIDAARLFPPTLTLRDLPGSQLYWLMRPELVKELGPLSSDALTGFGMLDRKEHNAEVKNAMTVLLTKKIPQFAKEASDEQLQSDLKGAIHKMGINMRYCGHILAHIEEPARKGIILSEMAARCFKNELFAIFRDIKDVGIDVFHAAVTKFVGDFPELWKEKKLVYLKKYFCFCRKPKYNADEVVNKIIGGCPAIATADVISRGLHLSGVQMMDDGVTVEKINVLVKRLRVPEAQSLSFEELENFYHLTIEVQALLNLAELYFNQKGQLDKATTTITKALEQTSQRRGPASVETAEVLRIHCEFLLYIDLQKAREGLEIVLDVRSKEGMELYNVLVSSFIGAAISRDFSRCKTLAASFSETVWDHDVVMKHNTLKLKIVEDPASVETASFQALLPEIALHSRKALCLKSEAELLLYKSRYEEADKLLQEAGELEMEYIGETCWELAETWSLRGRVQHKLGNGGNDHFAKSIEIAQSLCGDKLDPRAAYLLWNSNSNQRDAVTYERALVLLTRLFGETSPVLAQLKRFAESSDDNAEYLFISHMTMMHAPKDDLAFHIASLSKELKQLLNDSGVTNEDLMDPSTVSLIFTTLLETFSLPDDDIEVAPDTTKKSGESDGDEYGSQASEEGDNYVGLGENSDSGSASEHGRSGYSAVPLKFLAAEVAGLMEEEEEEQEEYDDDDFEMELDHAAVEKEKEKEELASDRIAPKRPKLKDASPRPKSPRRPKPLASSAKPSRSPGFGGARGRGSAPPSRGSTAQSRDQLAPPAAPAAVSRASSGGPAPPPAAGGPPPAQAFSMSAEAPPAPGASPSAAALSPSLSAGFSLEEDKRAPSSPADLSLELNAQAASFKAGDAWADAGRGDLDELHLGGDVDSTQQSLVIQDAHDKQKKKISKGKSKKKKVESRKQEQPAMKADASGEAAPDSGAGFVSRIKAWSRSLGLGGRRGARVQSPGASFSASSSSSASSYSPPVVQQQQQGERRRERRSSPSGSRGSPRAQAQASLARKQAPRKKNKAPASAMSSIMGEAPSITKKRVKQRAAQVQQKPAQPSAPTGGASPASASASGTKGDVLQSLVQEAGTDARAKAAALLRAKLAEKRKQK